MDVKMKTRKAQMSIFIIIGVILVSLIILFFVFRGEITPGTSGGSEEDLSSFLDSCIENKVKESVKTISSQGGYIENQLNKKFKFEGENSFVDIAYLCYTQNNYVTCVNQEPMLIKHLKTELKEDISEEMNNCFDSLALSLEEQAYVVDARYRGFDIELFPKRIIIDINAELTLTKSGATSREEDFKIIIPSRFYDLSIVVQEIVSQEARFCHFEQLGFMLIYPQFNIDKFRSSDSTIIYTVEDRDSKERFRFAVKGCVIPPGI